MQNEIFDIRDAAALIAGASRILVIGCSGGGKTTFSRRLSAYLALDYISMDRDFFWLPGWVKREKGEERRLIAEAVAKERWLMDGTGSSTFDLRLPRTEFVVWVRLPRWRCLFGVIRRGLRHFGRTRPDMAPGCVEQFPDWEFLSYIWTFEKNVTPSILRNLDRHGPHIPVFQLKSHREMRRLLDLIGAPA